MNQKETVLAGGLRSLLHLASTGALLGAVRDDLGADQWQPLALPSGVGQTLSEVLQQCAVLAVLLPLLF